MENGTVSKIGNHGFGPLHKLGSPRTRRGSRLFLSGIAILLFAMVGCSGKDDEEEILVAADPPSLDKGQSVNVELRSTSKLFTEAIKEPLASEGGLVLEAIRPRDGKLAVATFTSDKETEVGIHHFDLAFGVREARVTLSVMAPDKGPGTVTAEYNVASSGADFAHFVITGEGTEFDRNCEVAVQDAAGFDIRFIDVEDPRHIQVYYDIDVDQEPTEAKVVLRDGDYRYEMPFVIVEHDVFDNMMEGQAVEAGRVGKIMLYNPGATLISTTLFDEEDEAVETGDAIPGEEGEVDIPVRVPFDSEETSLEMTARTYLEGNAFLELMHTKIAVVPPAYLAFQGAKVALDPGKVSLPFTVQGVDANDIENIEVIDETGKVAVVDWEVHSRTGGELMLYQNAEVEEGAYTIKASVGGREIMGVIAVSNWESRRAHVPEMTISAGDHLYLPVTVQAGDLLENVVEARTGSDDLEVVALTSIDEFTVVLEIALEANAFPSAKRVTLIGEEYDYNLTIDVSESGL